MLKSNEAKDLAEQYVNQILEIDAPISRNDLIRAFATGYDLGFLSSEMRDLTKMMTYKDWYGEDEDA